MGTSMTVGQEHVSSFVRQRPVALTAVWLSTEFSIERPIIDFVVLDPDVVFDDVL